MLEVLRQNGCRPMGYDFSAAYGKGMSSKGGDARGVKAEWMQAYRVLLLCSLR